MEYDDYIVNAMLIFLCPEFCEKGHTQKDSPTLSLKDYRKFE